MKEGNIDATQYTYARRDGDDPYDIIHVRAGRNWVERVVPPAGEAHAYDTRRWEHRIEVTVSPTGRSVRVHVNGVEIDLPPSRQKRPRTRRRRA